MIRDPKDLQRYDAGERANHWVVGISFILLALSGLAFFHPAFFPLTQLFGGGTWARILHPYIGVFMAFFFVLLFLRFHKLNKMTDADRDRFDVPRAETAARVRAILSSPTPS